MCNVAQDPDGDTFVDDLGVHRFSCWMEGREVERGGGLKETVWGVFFLKNEPVRFANYGKLQTTLPTVQQTCKKGNNKTQRV